MPSFVDRAKMTTTTTGTGSITLGAAVGGFQSFTAAGVLDGASVRYVIEDIANAWEIGLGTYTAAGATLTRGVLESSSGTTLYLSGSAVVYVTAAAADFNAMALQAALSAETARAETAEAAAAAAAANAPFRNFFMNGQFNVQQRGLGPWTTSAWTADRWQLQVSGDTVSASIVALTDTDRAAIGDEAATYGLQCAVTGAATAANYTVFNHNIEDVRRLSNKTVTLSFYARATAALNLGIRPYQSFGTGGSPSAVVTQAATTFALTTIATRYTVTFALGSTSGKTLGTNGNSCTGLTLTLSAGTTNAAVYGVGAQSGTFTVWGIQLEIGSAASAVEKRPLSTELALCERFYVTGGWSYEGYLVNGNQFFITLGLLANMRTAPTVTITTNGAVNIGTVQANMAGTNPGANAQIQIYATATASTICSGYGSFAASADL